MPPRGAQGVGYESGSPLYLIAGAGKGDSGEGASEEHGAAKSEGTTGSLPAAAYLPTPRPSRRRRRAARGFPDGAAGRAGPGRVLSRMTPRPSWAGAATPLPPRRVQSLTLGGRPDRIARQLHPGLRHPRPQAPQASGTAGQ